MRPPLRSLALLVALAPSVAGAHAFDPAVLEIRQTTGEGALFELSLRVPPALAARAGDRLRPRWSSACAPLGDAAGSLEAAPLRLRCDVAATSTPTLGLDGLDGAQAEVLVHFLGSDGSERAGALHADADRFPLRPPVAGPLPVSSSGAVLGPYLALGVRHILGGFNHLAFLAALFLLLGSTAALVRAVTAFTLAHSVTLALSATGLVVLPQPPVEALIAASVLLLAGELATPPAAGARPSLLRRVPALAALLFGLLHGLGFAAALREAGLPADRAPLALLGFNLGVELGQLAVLALVLAPLAVLGRRARAALAARGGAWRPVLAVAGGRLPSYALGALSAAWLIDRVGAVLAVGAAP